MKAKLIKINEGEYILAALHKNLPKWFKIAFELGDGYYAFASNTLIGGIKNLSEIQNISLENCQAIERGYDLNALAENWVFTLNGHKWSNNDDTAGDNYGSFMAGAKTILAIFMDKKFTERQLRKAIVEARACVTDNDTGVKFLKEDIDIIQSLKKNEWDVEICCLMDCQGDYDVCENTSFDCELCTNTGVPKLDEDGCLILKLA